jgi:hypothetical protein
MAAFIRLLLFIITANVVYGITLIILLLKANLVYDVILSDEIFMHSLVYSVPATLIVWWMLGIEITVLDPGSVWVSNELRGKNEK